MNVQKILQQVVHSQNGVGVTIRHKDGRTLVFVGVPEPIVVEEGREVDIAISAVGHVAVPLMVEAEWRA